MKKNFTRILSIAVTVLMTLSSTATPLARRGKSINQGRPGISTPVAPAVGSADIKGALQRPQMIATFPKSIFSSSITTANLKVKAPYKVETQAETTGLPDLIGSVIYSDDFSGIGLYTIPTNSTQEFTRLFRYANAEYGGVLVDDMYYTCECYENPWSGNTIIYTGYDMKTGRDDFEVFGSYHTYSMTYDPTTSTIYAIANIDGFFALTKIAFDLAHNSVIFDPVAAIVLDEVGIWNAIACDSKGQLWAVFSDFEVPQNANDPLVCTGSTLYRIDKNTAVPTKVGDTGYDSLYASDAIFDLKTDRLFWTVMNTSLEGFLTEIDTTTGAATILYAFPGNEEVTGLAIIKPEAEDGAPAAVTDLTTDFTEGSLNGTVGFKTPTTLFDGTETTGDLTYTVTANGTQVATGTAAFGTEVAASVTVPEAGFYTFTVYVSNDAGDGPKSEITAFVGADTPEATSVQADYEDGVMTVSWLPVTKSINGGYIDLANITYTVTRYPDKEVVAEGISTTVFTENLPEPAKLTTYYYEVVATAGNLSSEAARSNPVILGTVVPPFTATFEDSLDGFTVVDANGDGISWISIDGRARIVYNSSAAMDDWLISPGIKLQGGSLYDIAAEFACLNPNFYERIEVKVGKSVKPEDMTTVLLDATDIVSEREAPMEWNHTFIPETDGTYYFGIHGISDKDRMYLYVDNFSVSEPKIPNAPAAVTELAAVPGDNGALTATVSFVTPSITLEDTDLTALAKVELLRGTEVVNTWIEPAVGASLSYTDNLPAPGTYTYTVIAYTPEAAGPESVVSLYVGVDYPAAVGGVNAFETDNAGEVTITWDPVTTTAEGASLDPSMVQYQVYRIENGSPVAISGLLDATTYTYQAVPAGGQEFVQFVLVAKTDRGYGKMLNGSLSQNFPAGTPYKGMSLSNANDISRYILGTSSAGGASWSVYDDTLIPSQDSDDRLLGMYGPFEDCYGDLYTGLISLEGIADPGLTFYTYNIGDIEGDVPDINEITVSVRERGDQEYVTAKTVVVSETGPVHRWNRVSVDLSEYAGKVIQVNFYSIVKAAVYTLIDNIRIGTIFAHDLAITSISAPSKVTKGDNFAVDVTVTNEGAETAENYSVELYAGKELVATQTGEAIGGGDNTVVKFDLTMSPLATGNIVYSAKVVLSGDGNHNNDSSKTVTVSPVASVLPAVTDLAAAVSEAGVRLTWSEPDFASIPADAVTEDFENGLSFAPRYGEWTFVDMDRSPVDGFSNMDIPNIVEGVTMGSFWIWDTDTRGTGNGYFAAHSGSKYLFALYRADMGQSDEWAISPELNGTAQTISFYAKSYSGQYPEKINVGYSTGSTDPSDFVVVKTINPVASDWTCYEFDVPEGAKYFAINSCARNAFMLMVDDVTYIPEGAPVTTHFTGYDIYRDGVKINSTPIETCEYLDTDVENGKIYEYVVVAVYNKGQAEPSDAVSILYQQSGLDNIDGAGIMSVVAENRSIVITGAAGQTVEVYAVDGTALYVGKCALRTVIPVQQGVYVVNVGKTAVKVLVK